MDDHEGLAIRAALDVWGLSLDPPRAGNAAIRAALKEVLIDCMQFSSEAIRSFRAGADGFQMRMHHSLYLTSLVSAFEIACVSFKAPYRKALFDELRTKEYDGEHVYNYVRELRNAVVHRGFDLTTRGVGTDGSVFIVAPSVAANESGSRRFERPAPLLQHVFIHCEIALESTLKDFTATILERSRAKMTDEITQGLIEQAGEVDLPEPAGKLLGVFLAAVLTPQNVNHFKEYNIAKIQRMLEPQPGERLL